MADGIELATAYVSIVPSTRGVGPKISSALGAGGEAGGKKAGGLFRGRFSRGANGAAKDTESAFGKTFKRLAIAAGGIFAAKKLLTGITGTANAYKSIVGEAVKLRRYTGGSIEDASRLRFVAQQVGIDVGKWTKGLGLFNKQLVAGKLDQFIGKTRDASGNLLPMTKLLPKIAEQFKNMPEGPEKTALAMKLFGRAGADLIPLLNKGADGVDALMKKADELGVTLTDGDVEAMKKANENSRLWKASLESVRIQIGRYVLPVLTKFTGFLASKMPKAIGFVRQALGILFKGDFKGDGPLSEDSPIVANLFKFRKTVQSVMGVVGDVFHRVVKFVTPFVDRIKSFFATDPDAKFAVFATVIGGVVLSAVWSLTTAVLALFSPVLLTVAAVGALAAGAIYAYRHFAGFRKVVDGVAKWMVGTAWPAIQSFGLGIAHLFQSLVGWVRAHWGQIKGAVSAVVSWLTGTAWPIVQSFGRLVGGLWSSMVTYVRRIWPSIQEAIGHVIVVIRDVIGVTIGIILKAWNMWGDNIWNAAQRVFGFVRNMIGNVMQVIRGIIQTVLAIINGDWGKAWDGIKGILAGVWDEIVNTIKLGVGIAADIISGIGEAIGSVWSKFWHGLTGVVKSVWNDIISIIGTAVNIIIDFLNTLNFTFKIPDIIGLPHRGEKFTIGISGLGHVHWGETDKKKKSTSPLAAAGGNYHAPQVGRSLSAASSTSSATMPTGAGRAAPLIEHADFHGNDHAQMTNALNLWDMRQAREVAVA